MKSDIDVQERDAGLLWITISRLEKHNALARSVLDSLTDVIQDVGSRVSTKIMVLRGAGDKFFAAGGDIVELNAVRTHEQIHAMADGATRALAAVRECPLPVIAYLNGDALGGGAELAVACDMRMFAPHARIGFIQGRMGISSAWGGGADLFRLVGGPRAIRMMARCEMVDVSQAMAWGLADLEAADESAVAEYLLPMLERPRSVLEGIKQQATAWRSGLSFEEHRQLERQCLLKTWTGKEHWQAVERFMNRSKQ